MKFSFPHIRNDHLEAHQKIWRKHRRVALHSNPEEISPIMHPELAPCSDKLLVIETPQSLSCSTADTLYSSGSTTACHTSSCSPCDICVRAEPLQGFITLVTSLWQGNSSAPTSPCRAAPSPRGVLLQHQPRPQVLCVFPAFNTPERGQCACDYRQNTEANLKKTLKPSEHSKLFSSVTKLAPTCTRISFSPKEGHGAKVFYQSESNKFITWALFKLSKSPTAKHVNSFWHEISDLVENCWASATPGSAFHQQGKVPQSIPQIISSFNCILKIF